MKKWLLLIALYTNIKPMNKKISDFFKKVSLTYQATYGDRNINKPDKNKNFKIYLENTRTEKNDQMKDPKNLENETKKPLILFPMGWFQYYHNDLNNKKK